jgi:predicted MFS family arabinose efflux permease
MKLWTGQTISQFGSLISREALPFAAVLVLGATPAQMGLLIAAGAAPVLLLGLIAGVWVDRLRRRPILIAADLLRALLLLSIPAAWLLGALRIEQLYVVAMLTSSLTLFFDVAYQSYLPSLVQRDRLVEGNSKLGMSASIAEVAGPPIGGGLMQLIGAPLAVLVDAASFLASALLLSRIKTPEPALRPPAEAPPQIRREITDGLRTVWRQPLLRAMAGGAALFYFSENMIGPLYGLYVLKELGLSPAIVGLITALGGASALLGALLAEPLARRVGPGPALIGALCIVALMALLLPLARGSRGTVVALLLVAQIGDAALAIFGINELSLRQSVTPDALLGRVNASMRLIETGVGPLGALLGGALGALLGLRTTMVVAVLGILVASIWLAASPLRNVRALAPDVAATAHDAPDERESGQPAAITAKR